jgi:hypothetical protein
VKGSTHAGVKGALALIGIAAACLLAAGCGGTSEAKNASAATEAPRACPAQWVGGWQKLADRIGAPVYCPTWLPDPLTAQVGGRWNNIDSVSKDKSYLESFVWQETGPGAAGGELHVNLRGYPGRRTIPTCIDTRFVTKTKVVRTKIPCFADERGTKTANGIRAKVYTVNQDADQWHILYAWRANGGLYTVSEHVAPPLTYSHVVRYLDRILRGLVLVEPRT